VLAALTAAVVTLGLAACASDDNHARETTWVTDDLLQDDRGRYYVTCEDSTDELHEKEVFVPDGQEIPEEGEPCPGGEVRTAPHIEEPEDEKAETKIRSVPRPTKSTTSTTTKKKVVEEETTTTRRSRPRPTR
jgi:hypothetical protein